MSTQTAGLARLPQAGMTSADEYGAHSMEATAETAATAIAARATAIAQAKFVMAHRNPRNMDAVRVALLRACERPGFAGSLTEKTFGAAWYRKPVGDGVEGFSVRFAEEAIRALGNIDVQVVTIYDDARQRIVEVTVMDLEANISYPTSLPVEKTVERSKLGAGQVAIRTRVNSWGKPVYVVPATEDEVFTKQQSLVSKAIRNGALRLLPGDIQAECRARILAIRQGEVAKDPEGFRRRLLDSFAALNIFPAMVAEYLRHPVDTSTPAELDDLRGLYLALKEGRTTWAEVMAPPEDVDDPAPEKPKEPKPDRLAEAAEKLKAAAPAPAKSAPAVQNPDADDAPEAVEPTKAASKKTEPKQSGLLGEEPAFLRAQARAARAAQGEK